MLKLIYYTNLLFILVFSCSTDSLNDHWYQRTQLFKEELKTLEKGGIVFLGNSIIEGFDLDLYFNKTNIINRGINSDHIVDVIKRIHYSVFDLKPAQLFILIGINDIGRQDSDSKIINNYNTLLKLINNQIPETRVFIHSILPTTAKWENCPPEKIQRLNKDIRNLSKRYKYEWIDLYSLFVNQDSYLTSELTSDGLHLNAKGYQIWANELIKLGFI